MSITLTSLEIASLLAERSKLVSSIEKRQEAIDAQDDVVAAATANDNSEKKAFDFYDIDVIGNYESEREELDGQYVDTPITKTELDNIGKLISTERAYPALPDTEPVRIDQFDGTPLIQTDNEIPGVVPDPLSPVQLDIEPYWVSKQGDRETWLQSGFGGTSPTITPTTFIVDAITPTTTQITVQTTVDTENPVFAVGDTFVAIQGGNQVGILVTNIVSQVNGDPLAGSCSGEDNPPQLDEASCLLDNGTWTSAPTTYEAVLDVAILVPLSLGASATIDETWAGFSNTDRTNKVDATDGYTNMLLAMIDDLELMIDSRKLTLDDQKTALQANGDSGLDPQAEIDVDAAIAVLDAWKVSKNVADSDLTTLSNERATRSPQITARIAAITAALPPFYDDRYTSAVNIGDTSRGTARIKFFRIDSQGATQGLKDTEEARLQAIDELLTLAGVPIP